jgi:hypothetical protein
MSEENAKTAGVAAGATTVGGIAVAASGSSAAEMSKTLAEAGSIVGGGMAVGIGLTAAAPLVIGAAVYGIFSLFDD